jgi:hypothetical protein
MYRYVCLPVSPYSGVKIENLMDRNTSRLFLVLFKRYYRGASMKPVVEFHYGAVFCNIGVKRSFVENVENRNFFYIMHIFLENSLLLQLKNAGIM